MKHILILPELRRDMKYDVPTAIEVFTDAEVKKITEVNHSDNNLSIDFRSYINEKIGNLITKTFAKTKINTIEPINVLRLNMLGYFMYSTVADYGKREARFILHNPTRSNINLTEFHKRLDAANIKNANGYSIKFTEKGALYLAGLMEYLLSELLDIGRIEVKKSNETTITKEFLEAAIAKDKDISEVFDPPRDYSDPRFGN